MEQQDILNILQNHYPMRFDTLELVRDSGSMAYKVFSGDYIYFLRAVKPAFFDTALHAVDIHVFLQKKFFPVPPVVFTKDNEPCIRVKNGHDGGYLFILYEFIEGGEADPEKDAENIGALVGKLHRAMKDYPGALVRHKKPFFIGRYLDILCAMQYPNVNEFQSYGDMLWDKVCALPRGYCHGDMYRGNIHKTPDGRLYVLDFDTSCEAFPMYDPVLICNMTDYFNYDEHGYDRSERVLERFLPEYLKYHTLSKAETDAFFDLIAVYHFQVQATVMEIFGYNCVDNEFLDQQLDWLRRWREQCGEKSRK